MYGINCAGKCAYRLNFLTTKALFYLHRGCPKMAPATLTTALPMQTSDLPTLVAESVC